MEEKTIAKYEKQIAKKQSSTQEVMFITNEFPNFKLVAQIGTNCLFYDGNKFLAISETASAIDGRSYLKMYELTTNELKHIPKLPAKVVFNQLNKREDQNYGR